MNYTELLKKYENKNAIVNGIEAKQLREKNTGTIKGETRILAVHDDYIEYKIHNVSKKDNKSDDLEETIEIINIPINKIESVSEGEKKNDLANAKLFTEQK